MADGDVKIAVGMDTTKAEKDLAKLKDKINQAEDKLNKTSGQRDAISERLDNAAKKAEAARQKIAELNEELNKGSDPMAKPQDTKEIQAMIQKRNQLVEEMRKIDTTATRALQEDINRAKGEQAGYQSHLEKIEDRAARLGISPDQYAKEVDKIKSTKLQPLEERIAQLSSQLDIMRQASGEAALSSQIRDLDRRIDLERQKAAEATGAPSAEEAQKINAQIVEQQKLIKDAEKEAAKLKTEFEKVDEKVKDGEKDLEAMKEQAGQMTREIARAKPGEVLANSLVSARKQMMMFLKYAFGIRSLFFLFRRLRSSITSAVQGFAEYDKETKQNMQNVKTALSTLQAAFGSGFAQIYNDFSPILQSFIQKLTDAANATSRFIALVSGKSSYKKAVANNTDVAQSYNDVAEAAEEAQKQVMGFDELNVLSDSQASGGKSAAAKAFKYEEEKIEPIEGSFMDKLARNVKDVLFDWSDLNPEQIAKKIIAGLGGLLGLALGITLGLGPGGILLLTIAGVALGLIADTLIFDNDGKLSKKEILDMILLAVNGLLGGVIGFTLTGGSIKGALIGAVIATGLTLGVKAMTMSSNGKISGFAKFLAVFLTTLAGGIIGFKIGNVPGAIIGIIAGIALNLVVSKLQIKLAEEAEAQAEYEASEFAKEIQGIKDRLSELMEVNAELRVHIDSITGEVDEADLANFALAKQLIDEIFSMDETKNKTAEQVALIQQKIELLNSLGFGTLIEGFDEVTSHVIGSRGEVQGLLDDILKQYQLEAMKDAYIESFKAQYSATEDVKKATEEAQAAAKQYEEAQARLEAAQTKANEALRTYQQYQNEIASSGSGSAVSEQAVEAQGKWAEAKKELEQAKLAAEDAKTALDTSKGTLSDTLTTLDTADAKLNGVSEKLAEIATEAETEGSNAALGYKEGFDSGSEEAVKAAAEMALDSIEAVQKAQDSHSPSKVYNDLAEDATEGYYEGWINSADKIVNAVEDTMKKVVNKAAEISQGIPEVFGSVRTAMERQIDGLRSLMNFSWALPKPAIPVFGYDINTIQYGNGQRVSFPSFYLAGWAARGAIVDKPTVLGVGEAGKEAIMPLENHTEWIDKLAEMLLARLAESKNADRLARAFSEIPRPAMANGYVTPPRAISENSGGFTISDVQGLISSIQNAVGGRSSTETPVIKVYLDGKEMARAVTQYQRRNERAYG